MCAGPDFKQKEKKKIANSQSVIANKTHTKKKKTQKKKLNRRKGKLIIQCQIEKKYRESISNGW